jgi:hypothetical protein
MWTLNDQMQSLQDEGEKVYGRQQVKEEGNDEGDDEDEDMIEVM